MNLFGQQIAHYQIKALLGRGRIGTVYQAVDLEDQSPVALKVVSLDLTQQPEFRQRFLSEVRALPRLEHPAIVKIQEAGIDTEQDILYLTMEYVTGRSLSAYLQQLHWKGDNLRVGEALLIVAQIAEALNYAHMKGVLHQDIRPNVILFKTPASESESYDLPRRAMLSDFALSSLLDAEKEAFQPALPYLSPERCLRREADGRSDIYALGILLYELVTGQQPFPVETLDDAIRAHTQRDPIPPTQLRADLPPRVETVILKAIAKRASDRYQTAAELAQALREAAAALPATFAVVQQDEVRSVDTQVESASELARHISQWTSHEDHLSITQDMPRQLNRRIITIGRSEDNDIVLSAASITRRHAQLERTATGWQVRDLGSRNGTYLDGTALLPNIPTELLSHQVLRIGPYYLQLQPGKGYAETLRPFDVFVNPTEIETAPGRERTVQVTITNQTAVAEEYALTVERLPAEWVTLPQGPVHLNPGEQASLNVQIRLPANGAVTLGRQQYLMVVNSLAAHKEMIAAPGTLNVQSAANEFSIGLQPVKLTGRSNCQLIIKNEGSVAQSYNIIGRSPDDVVIFTEWRSRLQKDAARGSQSGTRRTGMGSKKGMAMARRISPLNRIMSAPRRLWLRAASWPRQALNRILPGLGALFPRLNPPKIAPSKPREAPKSAKPALTFSRSQYETVVYPSDLQTQVQVQPGQQHMLNLRIAPRKRPFLGRHNQTLPYELHVATPTSRRQTVSGEMEIKPRIRTRLPAGVTVVLLMLLCIVSAVAYGLVFSQTWAAVLTAPRDPDGDTLSTLREVYVLGTDPHLADTDGDSLPDNQEISLGFNPNKADSDGDGLSDSQEQQLETNPLAADTDGDTLFDGLEVYSLQTDPREPDTLPIIVKQPTPTLPPSPTPLPTTQPTATAVPAITTPQLTLFSEGLQDGSILQEESRSGLAFAAGDTLQVGDTAERSQLYKSVLSFDTSTLLPGTAVTGAQLRLHINSSEGNPALLGQIHVDIAPATGFNDNIALENNDAIAPAVLVNAMTLRADGDEWYSAEMTGAALALLNQSGYTQFRIYFTLPNNANGVSDLLLFDSGDATTDRPQLVIVYNEP
ncbi:MAG: protein kinase [Ardenticatenaceae bacterium]|nr:protein kinase [Anaerolineales bacterium]MCB8920853.1 protein kinase [Ardenticatenaceae bacterium]MCB8991633.1 protein kinase [Ardenticatenaceae bacterium]MCB9002729.1 protein kinase [Ardenticatenaceae bacterium]